MNLILTAVLLGALQTEAPLPATRDPRVALFAGVGVLEGGSGPGSAVEGGVRLKALQHLAASFDLGYGVLGVGTAQDRWWLMPSLALTFALGPTQVDLGAGLGLGASSGYPSWSSYAAGPFNPTWAFQLVPEARVHASVSMSVTSSVRLFARLEAASLLLDGGVGFREGTAPLGLGSTAWLHLALGAQLGVW